MKQLAETHGIHFELLRHFLARMMDGEWSSTPGQWRNVVVSAFATLLPAGLLIVREGSLNGADSSKYQTLAMLADPGPFRAAAVADVLALLTLVLAVTGLLGLIQWQSFFPGRRDYVALAGLPIRSRQIFTARFGTVLIFSVALVVAMNILPSLIAPLEFGGQWQKNPSFWANVLALAASSGAGCFFLLFGMVGLQGFLWNALPARWFTRVSVYLQGLLVCVLFFGALYSFSIRDWSEHMVAVLPQFGWAPPVWFLGMHEYLLGDRDPFYSAMAYRGFVALSLAAVAMVLTYLVSYRRYRQLLVESPVQITIPGKRQWGLLRLIAQQPQQEAIMQFMAKTLARSRANRMIWLAYLGAAVAVMLNSSLIDGALLARGGGVVKALRFVVLFWPLGISVVMLNGIRHVLSIPAELPANWIFRLTEAQGRKHWMSAVERFILCYTIVPIYALLFPVSVLSVGWRIALRMTCLQIIVSMILFEILFYSWQQLPFACSYVPGKRPFVGILAGYVGMLCVIVPMLTVMISAAATLGGLFVFYLANFSAIWIWARKRRRDGWGESPLLYDDLPFAMPDLGIKDLAWGRPRFHVPAAAAARQEPPALQMAPVRERTLAAWLETFGQDIRYGLRQLRRSRGFSVVAALTLAVGIGATTSIYSMIDSVLWQPIPLPEPNRLAMILQAMPGQPHFWSPSAPADIDDIRQNAPSLESLASFQMSTVNLVDSGGEAMRVECTRVTPNFLDVAGVDPAIGRTFVFYDDQPGSNEVVILGDAIWRRHFGGDPAILGRTIRLDDRNFKVVGIMPPGFYFPRQSRELWIPLVLTPQERDSRNAALLDSAGRLRPGRRMAQLTAELNGISSRLEQQYPDTNAHRRYMAWTFQRYSSGDLVPVYTALLLGSALFVLLIACVNVMNLQFARATSREREIAIRTALGASRRRLIRQLITESTVLSFTGAALGLVFARWALAAIKGGIPAELLRYNRGFSQIGLNRHALTFTMIAAIASGVLAGLAPAWRGSRSNLTGAMGRPRHRLRSLLVGAELALAVVLLVGAGLAVRGFQSLVGGSTSMEPSKVLTLQLSLSKTKYAHDSQVVGFYREALERIGALPGVQSAVAASAVPYGRHSESTPVAIEGRPPEKGRPPTAQLQRVTEGYFQSMRIGLLSGRLPAGGDTPGTVRVAAISQSMARRWWTGGDSPIGARLQVGGEWAIIVGVVSDIEHSVIDRGPAPTVYVSHLQFPGRDMDIAIRTTGNAGAFAPVVRAMIRSLDAELPIANLNTMSNLIRQEAFVFAYLAALMGLFGIFALVLASVGVYGVMAYIVSGQTHEIGIRMALGAQRRTILGLLFGRGMRMTAFGLIAGVIPAFGLAQVMRAAVFGVNLVGPAVFGVIPLILIAAAAIAIYLPARRALKIDPAAALRSE